MRIFWDVVEKVDYAAIRVLDRLDGLRKKKPLMERTKERTRDVRAPQHVIQFDT